MAWDNSALSALGVGVGVDYTTTTAGTSNTFWQQLQGIGALQGLGLGGLYQQAPVPLPPSQPLNGQPADAEEVRWLKNRIREIEWRP